MPRNIVLLLTAALVAAALYVAFSGGIGPAGPAEDVQPGPAGAAEAAELPAPAPAEPERTPASVAELGQPERGAAGRAEIEPAAAPASSLVRVRIVDEEGEPIAGAFAGAAALSQPGDLGAMLDRMTGRTDAFAGRAEARSGENGVAHVRLTSEGPFRLVYARADGMAVGISLLQFNGFPEEFDAGDLTLRGGTTLAVEIVDEQDQPLEDALVSLLSTDLGRNDAVPFRMVRTDAAGKVAFPYLDRVDYALGVRKPGYVEVREDGIEPHEEESAQRRFVLERGGEISGRVLRSDGAAARGVAIELRRKERDWDFFDEILEAEPWSHADEEGRFELAGVGTEEEYVVRARDADDVYVDSEPVRAGAELTLRLPDGFLLSGRLVLADGSPAAGASFSVIDIEEGIDFPLPETVAAESDGSFGVFRTGGRYLLVAWHETGEYVSEQAVELSSPTDLGALQMQAVGELVLRFRSSAGGEPVPIERIDERPGPTTSAVDRDFERRRSDAIQLLSIGRGGPEHTEVGTMRMAAVMAGTRRFTVIGTGHVRKQFDVEVAPGRLTEHEVLLSPAATLKVVALGADGAPAEGVLLLLRPADDQQRWSWNQARTDGGGRAQFSQGVEPGAYKVMEMDTGSNEQTEAARVDLLPGENEAQVQIAARFAVEVRVRDGSGPVAGAHVRVFPAGADADATMAALRRSERSGLRTDAEGTVMVEDVRTGRYTVVASRGGGFPAQAAAEIHAPGQQVVVFLEGSSISGWILDAPQNASVQLHRRLGDEERAQLRSRFGDDQDFERRLWQVQSLQNAEARCSADGTFEFLDLPPGLYDLSPEAAGYYSDGPERVELESLPVASVELRLVREGRLTVRVRGISQEDRRDYVAMLYRGSQRTGQPTWIGRGGEFAVHRAPPGSYTLKIHRGWQESAPLAEFAVDLDAHTPTVIDWDASNAPH